MKKFAIIRDTDGTERLEPQLPIDLGVCDTVDRLHRLGLTVSGILIQSAEITLLDGRKVKRDDTIYRKDGFGFAPTIKRNNEDKFPNGADELDWCPVEDQHDRYCVLCDV